MGWSYKNYINSPQDISAWDSQILQKPKRHFQMVLAHISYFKTNELRKPIWSSCLCFCFILLPTFWLKYLQIKWPLQRSITYRSCGVTCVNSRQSPIKSLTWPWTSSKYIWERLQIKVRIFLLLFSPSICDEVKREICC